MNSLSIPHSPIFKPDLRLADQKQSQTPGSEQTFRNLPINIIN